MRTQDEITKMANLSVQQVTEDGGCGIIVYNRLHGTVVWSYGAGWDHVSVSSFRRGYTPTWDDMCKVKEMFFYPDETVVEYHPAESQYVNAVSNCLHLWRPQKIGFPLPPMILTGTRGYTGDSQLKRMIKEAYEDPYGLTSDMLEVKR